MNQQVCINLNWIHWIGCADRSCDTPPPRVFNSTFLLQFFKLDVKILLEKPFRACHPSEFFGSASECGALSPADLQLPAGRLGVVRTAGFVLPPLQTLCLGHLSDSRCSQDFSVRWVPPCCREFIFGYSNLYCSVWMFTCRLTTQTLAVPLRVHMTES